MTLALYTNSVSAHQLPLARALARRLGAGNFHYVFTGEGLQRGGQEVGADEPWIARGTRGEAVEACDVLLSGVRDVELFEARAARGLRTFYMSERWFKPRTLFRVRAFDWLVELPGWVRMLSPGYLRLARRVADLLVFDPNFRYCAISPWAARDMEAICRFFHPLSNVGEKMVSWGYFVAPSAALRPCGTPTPSPDGAAGCRRILWVGRMIDWKRVETIVRAVRLAVGKGAALSLTLVGDGPERARLTSLSQGLPVTFLPPQPIEKIRDIMRAHDVYVLPSSAQEGWGAALNEAIEEGLMAVGTDEAGASAALLPTECRFRAGDWRALAELLAGPITRVTIGRYGSETAAEFLLGLCASDADGHQIGGMA